jgi:hypothetical protein
VDCLGSISVIARGRPATRSDVLRALVQGADRPEIRFAVHVRNDNREGTPPLVRLKARGGPGDDGAPVITVMEIDED